jgi:hypothetical protein
MRVPGPSALPVGVGFALLLLLLMAVPVLAEGQAAALPVSALPFQGTPATGPGQGAGRAPTIDFTPTVTVYLPSVDRRWDPRLPYLDDFSNPSSGWKVSDSGNTVWFYTGGEYEILMRNAGWWAGATCPLTSLTDYSVEADMHRPAGATSSYGLIFGFQDWSHFYLLVVSPDSQMYAVLRQYDGWTSIVDWGGSTAIKTQSDTNHLQVERTGAHINAYANGQLLASADDSSFMGGLQVGVYAQAGNSVPDAAYFDNFSVQAR